ncbi:unnamed protein product [Miscanthus lutarioriparius]|uniref:Uncharacterized protein n=1 Tax=Miscanthus lutarioriparius TaxID=422564 RepID=A0A811PH69_9POAL|nr:unnamed protein product [Miscanthus lutarioriparius]
MAVVISSSGMYGSTWRATATTTTLLLALAAAAGLLLTPVAARGSPEHDKQQQQREDDRILGLPGQPNGVAFGMYGGYVTIDDDNGRTLYYCPGHVYFPGEMVREIPALQVPRILYCRGERNTIFDNWGQAADDLLPVYRELIQAGLRVWVFSGDTDSVVPVSSTRRSLAALGLPVKTSWYPWYMAPTEREVGGWSVQYEGLTYITVRGAGHLVPVHRPAQAFLLFTQFLKGEPMPAEEKNDILLPSEKKAPF